MTTSFRKLPALALASSLALALPALAAAQDFGVMESAETIDRGTWKLRFNPMVLFGDDLDREVGIAAKLGYGLTDRFDLEGAVAFYDGVQFFGGDAEYWIVRNEAVDFSVIGGLHVSRGENTLNTFGVDLTFLASGHVTDRLELFGALDIAFEEVTEDDIDFSFTPIHLVPGIEYRITDDLDFVAEVGIGVNDDARNYFSAGLAIYFR